MNTYWWYRPSRIALLIVMPMAFCAFFSSNHFYEQFGAFNAITSADFFLMWLSILGFAGGSWLGEILVSARPPRPLPFIRETNFRVILFGLASIATLATFIFLAPFVGRPDMVLSVLAGDPNASAAVSAYADEIPGITSQENLFSLVIVLLMAKRKLTGYPRIKVENLLLVFILLVTLLKVIIHTERLALIELAIPLSLLIGAQRKKSMSWALAPVVGIVGLFLFFMGTEYLRSWVSFYSDRSNSLVDFAFNRMLGYYMTAFNNGAYIYAHRHSLFFPTLTGAWIWSLPIPDLKDALRGLIGIRDLTPLNFKDLLAGLNIEFNNISGVFAPLVDFGEGFGVVVWVILGYISGRLFRRFAEAHPLGLILFPTWYVGVLEIPREFYWGDSRYFPPLVASLAVVSVFVLLLPKYRGRTMIRTKQSRNDLYGEPTASEPQARFADRTLPQA